MRYCIHVADSKPFGHRLFGLYIFISGKNNCVCVVSLCNIVGNKCSRWTGYRQDCCKGGWSCGCICSEELRLSLEKEIGCVERCNPLTCLGPSNTATSRAHLNVKSSQWHTHTHPQSEQRTPLTKQAISQVSTLFPGINDVALQVVGCINDQVALQFCLQCTYSALTLQPIWAVKQSKMMRPGVKCSITGKGMRQTPKGMSVLLCLKHFPAVPTVVSPLLLSDSSLIFSHIYAFYLISWISLRFCVFSHLSVTFV